MFVQNLWKITLFVGSYHVLDFHVGLDFAFFASAAVVVDAAAATTTTDAAAAAVCFRFKCLTSISVALVPEPSYCVAHTHCISTQPIKNYPILWLRVHSISLSLSLTHPPTHFHSHSPRLTFLHPNAHVVFCFSFKLNVFSTGKIKSCQLWLLCVCVLCVPPSECVH